MHLAAVGQTYVSVHSEGDPVRPYDRERAVGANFDSGPVTHTARGVLDFLSVNGVIDRRFSFGHQNDTFYPARL